MVKKTEKEKTVVGVEDVKALFQQRQQQAVPNPES